MYIEVNSLSKEYIQNGEKFQALNNVSFSVEKGDFMCLLGSSGCGKSTLLNIMAGFENPSSGFVKIDGQEVKIPSPNHITIFQNYGLLPWRSVRKNVELGLEQKKIPKDERREISNHFIEMVGLSDFANSHPHQLSGGMQQRVAIARALAMDPDIIFMDEPFGALDAMTRIKMQDDILEITKSQQKTIIFVTHDIEEAIYLADKIVVMVPNPGQIKAILTVKLRINRDRTADDFLNIRNKVYQLLELSSEEVLEYYL